ncbi:MAG: hypothetical protein KIT40_01800 [Nitrospira sp.]|nr:hypothetical protein [Nitrospira sp.]
MSVKDDQKIFEEEKRARVSKIGSYLKGKTSTKAEHKAVPKAKRKADTTPQPQAPLVVSTTEDKPSVPVHDASAPNGLRYRALKPWERWEGVRVVQFRPMTRREREAEEDAKFFASVQRDTAAHAEKVKKAKQESEAWAKEDRQRREHEEQTGMRPYEPGRYLDIEDAAKRGYLSGSGS